MNNAHLLRVCKLAINQLELVLFGIKNPICRRPLENTIKSLQEALEEVKDGKD